MTHKTTEQWLRTEARSCRINHELVYARNLERAADEISQLNSDYSTLNRRAADRLEQFERRRPSHESRSSNACHDCARQFANKIYGEDAKVCSRCKCYPSEWEKAR